MELEEGTRVLSSLDEADKGTDGGWNYAPRGVEASERVYPRISGRKAQEGATAFEIRSIPFDERDPTKVFKIGTTLGAEHEAMLVRVLREYQDVFAWEAKDVPRVDPEVSVHKPHVDPHYNPVKQKRRTFSEEKREAIREEVGKLLGENAIWGILFPTWLANVMLVPKPNGTWQMCIDFTSINKAWLKDYYPLPNINRLVDSSAGYKVVDFLDAFRWYHQIFMAEEDVEKIAFVTKYDIYCWRVMAFGLKNMGVPEDGQ
ncbi:hypothetical protein LIER_35792 [Lithospermum erythrorhizon]|uniref:Reverse transcriptase domain-containing protein n=1 Tax=Lithospermum erythrorhizon TaxID=34254 RepID=A0AAV3P130_LITER